METPPRAPSESGELRALDVANQFHAGAPPHAGDIDLYFNVDFYQNYRYNVTITLYNHGTEDIVRWAELPKVSVTYRTESEEIPTREPIQLQFVHGQEGYAAFFECQLDFQWRRFLFIGMQFDGETVNYYKVTHQGQREKRMVVEMRKVSLSTYNTYARGSHQIWGKRYSGRAAHLAESFSN